MDSKIIRLFAIFFFFIPYIANAQKVQNVNFDISNFNTIDSTNYYQGLYKVYCPVMDSLSKQYDIRIARKLNAYNLQNDLNFKLSTFLLSSPGLDNGQFKYKLVVTLTDFDLDRKILETTFIFKSLPFLLLKEKSLASTIRNIYEVYFKIFGDSSYYYDKIENNTKLNLVNNSLKHNKVIDEFFTKILVKNSSKFNYTLNKATSTVDASTVAYTVVEKDISGQMKVSFKFSDNNKNLSKEVFIHAAKMDKNFSYLYGILSVFVYDAFKKN